MSRVRRKPGTKEALLSMVPPLILEPAQNQGNWCSYFKNNNPIHIELGMGRGTFITTMAQKYPNINFIGVELKEEVLLTAIKKTQHLSLRNLGYIWGDGKDLPEFFAPKELARIYLNFSDPWPKARHAKRRLTHVNFLTMYRQILESQGEVHFKTDNEELFEYSLNQFCFQNWKLKNISLDLYRNKPEDNVPTEYESKFVSQGKKIYRLEGVTA